MSEILPTLYSVLAAHQNGSARSLQAHVGPSEIGVSCQRQLAYKLAGAEKVNEDTDGLKWAPLVGTYLHSGIAEAFTLDNVRRLKAGKPARWIVEERVQIDGELGGTVDLYDLQECEVVDWKAVGKTRLQHYRRHGPGDQYRAQAHLYGLGYERAGLPVRAVRVVFLAKFSHLLTDSWEWSEPYRPALAHNALQRLAATRHLVAKLDLERDPTAYGFISANVGDDCRFCPYRRTTTAPADATGCPGDSAGELERSKAAFQRGLVRTR